MNNIQLSVVHRLPQSYRWSPGFAGIKVEPLPVDEVNAESSLMGLKLLSHEDGAAWNVMQKLQQSLADMQIGSTVIELEGQPCLFINSEDESAVMCRLKTLGAAIAEKITALYPF
ncbi:MULTISPECIES: YejG family protein [Photorhabdus]|uniref:YejG family protein n=1 Tax=Photorhabdus TaxID=29487 RepID=UPI000E5A0B95|nr:MULTISPECIES: YejG family protein [Photorhabdus]MCA6221977.1 YejG family protein [Photorhabdus antumapuensis]